MNTTTESENVSAPETLQPKAKRALFKKAVVKKTRAEKSARKPKADRANKRAQVIALMKRAKGETLAEIMAVTEWQAHTVGGFVSILGSKGGEKMTHPNAARRAYIHDHEVGGQQPGYSPSTS
jgi:hypothetical protein